MPILVYHGAAIFESMGICEFLEEAYPEPKLMPDGALQRAKARNLINLCDDTLAPLQIRMLVRVVAVHCNLIGVRCIRRSGRGSCSSC